MTSTRVDERLRAEAERFRLRFGGDFCKELEVV